MRSPRKSRRKLSPQISRRKLSPSRNIAGGTKRKRVSSPQSVTRKEAKTNEIISSHRHKLNTEDTIVLCVAFCHGEILETYHTDNVYWHSDMPHGDCLITNSQSAQTIKLSTLIQTYHQENSSPAVTKHIKALKNYCKISSDRKITQLENKKRAVLQIVTSSIKIIKILFNAFIHVIFRTKNKKFVFYKPTEEQKTIFENAVKLLESFSKEIKKMDDLEEFNKKENFFNSFHESYSLIISKILEMVDNAKNPSKYGNFLLADKNTEIKILSDEFITYLFDSYKEYKTKYLMPREIIIENENIFIVTLRYYLRINSTKIRENLTLLWKALYFNTKCTEFWKLFRNKLFTRMEDADDSGIFLVNYTNIHDSRDIEEFIHNEKNKNVTITINGETTPTKILHFNDDFMNNGITLSEIITKLKNVGFKHIFIYDFTCNSGRNYNPIAKSRVDSIKKSHENLISFHRQLNEEIE